nr:MAG TPA: hypothetical protein [Caudoviricetes sp.]
MAEIGNRKEPERRLCEFPGLGAKPHRSLVSERR